MFKKLGAEISLQIRIKGYKLKDVSKDLNICHETLKKVMVGQSCNSSNYEKLCEFLKISVEFKNE